jgi:hypothetical protein
METIETAIATTLVGTGATAFVDLFALARTRLFGVRAPDFGLFGRWLAHLLRGRLAVATSAPAVRGERAIGWLAHYAIGIAFAALLVATAGTTWLAQPTLLPALAVGIATVVAPWLVLQPAMGLGVAARKAPRPNAVRVQSLVTHAVFGLGLYAAALLVVRAPLF